MIDTSAQVGSPPGLRPYRGLDPFSADDAPFFFGREAEQQLIASNLLASKLTLLYGSSGVGKSSVLQAGVIAALRERALRQIEKGRWPKFVPVLLRSWSGDPVAGLLGAARASVLELRARADDRAGEAGSLPSTDLEPAGDLEETLSAWSRSLGSTFAVILDQFEEYFVYHDEDFSPGAFDAELAALATRVDARVNLLIGIREDSIARLDRYKGRIPNLFDNYLRIDHLDRESARSAIELPIEQYNRQLPEDRPRIGIEPGLVEAVLDEVSSGRVDLGTAGTGTREGDPDGAARGARVMTPFLQLVMSRVWQEEVDGRSDTLRVETLERLGGAERIIRTHLDERMAALEPGERDLAARVFRHLVTPSGMKIAHSVPDLADYAEVQEEPLRAVLERLSSGDARVLRPVAPPIDDPGAVAYEISHDVLAPAILDWRTRHQLELDRRRATEHARASRRKLVRRIGAVAIAAILIGLASGVALVMQTRARGAAEAAKLLSQSTAQLGVDPQDSVRLALEAWETSPTEEAEQALRRSVSASNVEAVMPGHTGIVWQAEFSPDGSSVVSAGDDGTARIWDPTTGKRTRILGGNDGHTKAVVSARFSPDGTHVATASHDETARIWDANSGGMLRVLEGHSAPLRGAVFSPDGAMIATWAEEFSARVWSAESGELVFELDGHSNWVSSVEFSPDGRWIVTSGFDGAVKLWNATTGELRSDLPLPDFIDLGAGGWFNKAVFSSDGSLVAAADSVGSVQIWDAETGVHLDSACCQRGESGTTDLAFSPDGAYLVAIGGVDAQIYEPGAEGPDVWFLHRALPNSALLESVAVSPDGSMVLTGARDGTARLWDLRSGHELDVLRGHDGIVWGASFGMDDTDGVQRIATVSEDGTLRVWSVPQGRSLVHEDEVSDVGFSDDGAFVATASRDGTARVWDTKSGRPAGPARTHEFIVTAVALSPGGETLATGSGHDVFLWDVGSTQDNHLDASRCCAMSHDVLDLAFDPSDPGALVVLDRARELRKWRRGTGSEWTSIWRKTYPLSQQPVKAAFSPDGRRLVVSHRDAVARVLDARNGSMIRTLEGHTAIVGAAVFSPRGDRIAATSLDGTGRVWDANTGRRLMVLLGSAAQLSGVGFTADGRRVVAGTTDGRTLMWDVTDEGSSEERFPLAYLRRHALFVNEVAVDPDGTIATAGGDDAARLYRCELCSLTLDQIVDRARRIARLGQA